jgi:hypothetical protein
MAAANAPSAHLGGGLVGSPAGSVPERGLVNCEICRSEMSTDGLLGKLRCAECRQLTFDRVCDAALKVGLTVCMGSMLFCLLARWAKRE